MVYKSKVFDSFYDLTNFLNKENIHKDEIINISVTHFGITLIYLGESEV